MFEIRTRLSAYRVIILAAAVGAAAFLGWYETVRNKGQLFLCDTARLVGQGDAIALCGEAKSPDDGTLLEQLEFLRARFDQLTPEKRALLRRLEAKFEERTFQALMEAMGVSALPEDERAVEDTREAVRETTEQGDPEERRALELIADGDLEGGLSRLVELADVATGETAARWRRIGRLAYGVDTARALAAYEKVVALGGGDPWDAVYLGRLHARAGNLAAARRIVEETLAALPPHLERDRAALLDVLGDLFMRMGDLPQALKSHQAALAIAERLAASDLKNAEWQRNLSVSHNKVGDVQRVQGDLAGALASYRASMEIREGLAASDPKNAQWQRDLSVSHNRIGNIQRVQGDLAGALKSYRALMAIAERLAASDPKNTEWQRDLSVSHNKIGNIQRVQGDLAGALKSYQADLMIAERLAASDPKNAEWQRDLSVSHNKIGNIQRAQGDLVGALKSYRALKAITERLAASDPKNADWRRGMAVSYERIGDVQRAQGDLAGALASHRASMEIKEELAASDPNNAEWQRDLAVSLWKLADFPESGVSWAQVADAWEGMAERGILAPADRPWAEEARRRAEAR